MNALTSTIRWARRFPARRDYTKLERALNDTVGGMYETDDPGTRVDLLVRVSRAVEKLAALHTAAHGADPVGQEYGRPRAEALAAEVELWDLAAVTEHDVSRARWTRVGELTAEHRVWFAGQFAQVMKVEPLACEFGTPVEVTLAFDDGSSESLEYDAADHVRTGGPARLEMAELLDGTDLPGEECRLWQWLSATYDRDARARLLVQLAEVASDRVGSTAAQALHVLADNEAAVACGGCEAHARARACEEARVWASTRLLLLCAMALLVWAAWGGDTAGWPWLTALWGGFALAVAARFGSVPLLPGNRWQGR